MTDSYTQNDSSETPNNNNSVSNEELAQLRSLLLGLDKSELDKLYDRLNNPNIQPEDLSKMLPEAIILRSMQDKQLSEAIVPTIEEAIQTSVRKDLTVLADAIFPVIGPASRKAIATTLEATIQSLNQSIEHSLSPQGFKWRLEALQTGKSFAEVVLLRTLLYRVEQVFLIHKKTGLLLQHVVANSVEAQDADLISAMLTAIRDFVQDSFSVQTGESLDTLQFGELTIWIEQGPQAILAGIIRGNAPKELKFVFQEAIEKIHRQQRKELYAFDGETSPFEASKPYLEDCLQTDYQLKKEKTSPFLLIFWGVILLALGSWGFISFRENRRWETYLEKLNDQPGITVSSAEKHWGKYYISGLRDPLAADPTALMKQANINPKAVISKWKPYLSLDSQFVVARAKQLLKPPETVSLKIDENGILYAIGSAPRQWIGETRKMVQFIPGITKYQEENLVDTESAKLLSAKAEIEKEVILFEEGTTQLIAGEEQKLQNLIQAIKNITNTARVLDKAVSIEILGHSNTGGSEQRNIILSSARANAIASILTSRGIETVNLKNIAVGSSQPLANSSTVPNQALNRRVSFKVIITDVPNRGIN